VFAVGKFLFSMQRYPTKYADEEGKALLENASLPPTMLPLVRG
jgi:hypothetical protein